MTATMASFHLPNDIAGVASEDDPMELSGDADRRGPQGEDIDLNLDTIDEEQPGEEDSFMDEDNNTTLHQTSHNVDQGVAAHDDEMVDDNFRDEALVDDIYIQDEDLKDADFGEGDDMYNANDAEDSLSGHIPNSLEAQTNSLENESESHPQSILNTSRTGEEPSLEVSQDAEVEIEASRTQEANFVDTLDFDLQTTQQSRSPKPVDQQLENESQVIEALQHNAEYVDNIKERTSEDGDNQGIPQPADDLPSQTQGELPSFEGLLGNPLEGDENETVSSSKTHVHPVVVLYEDVEMSLFPPVIENQEHSETFFLQDERIAADSIKALLTACRHVLADSIGVHVELGISIDDLGLNIAESSIHASETSLLQILEIYVGLMRQDGVDEPAPLYTTLYTTDSFTNRMETLRKALAEGEGFSAVKTEAFAEDLVGSGEHHDNESKPGQNLQTDNPTAETQHSDLTANQPSMLVEAAPEDKLYRKNISKRESEDRNSSKTSGEEQQQVDTVDQSVSLEEQVLERDGNSRRDHNSSSHPTLESDISEDAKYVESQEGGTQPQDGEINNLGNGEESEVTAVEEGVTVEDLHSGQNEDHVPDPSSASSTLAGDFVEPSYDVYQQKTDQTALSVGGQSSKDEDFQLQSNPVDGLALSPQDVDDIFEPSSARYSQGNEGQEFSEHIASNQVDETNERSMAPEKYEVPSLGSSVPHLSEDQENNPEVSLDYHETENVTDIGEGDEHLNNDALWDEERDGGLFDEQEFKVLETDDLQLEKEKGETYSSASNEQNLLDNNPYKDRTSDVLQADHVTEDNGATNQEGSTPHGHSTNGEIEDEDEITYEDEDQEEEVKASHVQSNAEQSLGSLKRPRSDFDLDGPTDDGQGEKRIRSG